MYNTSLNGYELKKWANKAKDYEKRWSAGMLLFTLDYSQKYYFVLVY